MTQDRKRHAPSLPVWARRGEVSSAALGLALLWLGCPHYGEPLRPDFVCNDDDSCPRLVVEGDAPPGSYRESPFRGYGDPSLERDPDTGVLWLSYSWLDHRGEGRLGEQRVRTHLARSEDSGTTFHFVRAVNAVTPTQHPVFAGKGEQLLWIVHIDRHIAPEVVSKRKLARIAVETHEAEVALIVQLHDLAQCFCSA